MKLFSTNTILFFTVFAFKSNGVSASYDTEKEVRFVRHLQANVGFLVSKVVRDADWCITASNGVGDFVPLGLKLCDFDGAPVDQLWQVDSEGKFASRLNTDFCMIVNDGETISDNDLVNTARCIIDSALNKFFWDSDSLEQLRPIADQTFCVTHLGPLPQDTDDIRVKLCTSESRYKWNFSIQNPYFMLESFNYDGCIEIENGSTQNDNNLILGPCNSNQGWRYDESGRFHSSANDDMCMQAARGGSIRDGSKLRIFTCGGSDREQQFDFHSSGRISLRSNPDFCVVFRGTNANVGVDPIVLKECNSVEDDRLVWDRVFISK